MVNENYTQSHIQSNTVDQADSESGEEHNASESMLLERIALYGDSYGFSATIVSACAFFAFVITLFAQQREMNVQRRMFKAQILEYKRNTVQAEKGIEAQLTLARIEETNAVSKATEKIIEETNHANFQKIVDNLSDSEILMGALTQPVFSTSIDCVLDDDANRELAEFLAHWIDVVSDCKSLVFDRIEFYSATSLIHLQSKRIIQDIYSLGDKDWDSMRDREASESNSIGQYFDNLLLEYFATTSDKDYMEAAKLSLVNLTTDKLDLDFKTWQKR